MAKNTKHSKNESICLNNQTAGNLGRYLKGFPPDARVVIHGTDSEGCYQNYDCQIGCNFEYQEKAKTVILFRGFVTDQPTGAGRTLPYGLSL